jgi:L-asparaginase / beta-aspartyl-peptidase
VGRHQFTIHESNFMTIALIVHGGAGAWRPGSDHDALEGTRSAVAAGRKILEAGGSALDAALAAAVVLEDNPIFNAGTGGVLNFDGEVELDACVMLAAPAVPATIGAVTGLKRVKNPILVARDVMQQTDHVMLTGDGALRFARACGHVDYDPITPDRRADWQDKREKLADGAGAHGNFKLRPFLKTHPEYAGGTIGVVAIDVSGAICAATSTGGYTLKLAGRVGDTPLPGAGTYATAHAGVSATGTGEYVIRALSGRQIADDVARGMTLAQAVDHSLDILGRDFDADVGFIAIDGKGNAYGNHRTRHMPHAWFENNGEIIAKMRVEK